MRAHLTAFYRGKPVSIELSSVNRFTTADKYVIAHHEGGELVLDSTVRLYQLEREYADTFIRVHRGCLVRRSLIAGIKRRYYGKDGCSDGAFLSLLGIPDPVIVSKRHFKAIYQLAASPA